MPGAEGKGRGGAARPEHRPAALPGSRLPEKGRDGAAAAAVAAPHGAARRRVPVLRAAAHGHRRRRGAAPGAGPAGSPQPSAGHREQRGCGESRGGWAAGSGSRSSPLASSPQWAPRLCGFWLRLFSHAVNTVSRGAGTAGGAQNVRRRRGSRQEAAAAPGAGGLSPGGVAGL